MVIQPDGKLVVGGEADSNFLVVRLLADGTLDATFGTSGLITTDFASSIDRAFDVVLQPDGKILVVGESDGDVALARYNVDGSLDASFGDAGLLTTDLGTVADDVNIPP